LTERRAFIKSFVRAAMVKDFVVSIEYSLSMLITGPKKENIGAQTIGHIWWS
jgi:hypothetical protein